MLLVSSGPVLTASSLLLYMFGWTVQKSYIAIESIYKNKLVDMFPPNTHK